MITFLYAQIAVIHFLDFDTSQDFKNNLQPDSHFMNIFINESNAYEAMTDIITSNQKIHSFIFNFSNENVYKNSCFHKVIQKIMYTYSPVEIFINILEENRNTQETIKKLIDSGIKKNPEITDTIFLRCPETLLFYINFIYNLNTKMFKTKKFSHITKFFINNHSYNPADFIQDRIFIIALICAYYIDHPLSDFHYLILESLWSSLKKITIDDPRKILETIFSNNSLKKELYTENLDTLYLRFLQRSGRKPFLNEKQPEETRHPKVTHPK
jgi:hypothetical protein